MNTPPIQPVPPPPPRVPGRTANRLLVAGLVLSLVLTGLLLAQDSDWMFLALLLAALFGLALVGLPATLFLVYSLRQPAPDVSPAMRRTIFGSAIGLVLCGAWLGFALGNAPSILAGAIGAALGLAAIARAVRIPAAPAGTPTLVYGRSSQAQLKNDLRNLVLREDGFFSEHHYYAARPEIQEAVLPSAGDSMVVVAADTVGWHAVARPANLPSTACGIWIGMLPAGGMHGAPEGEPRRWPDRK
ncbi:MAG: hypothetical protein HY700_17140 [Gemmatimonadetes bacterium]|nr:hypothetical protein [Gemmatimonadota bacterium]